MYKRQGYVRDSFCCVCFRIFSVVISVSRTAGRQQPDSHDRSEKYGYQFLFHKSSQIRLDSHLKYAGETEQVKSQAGF